MKLSFYTLGCKVNQYETQAMEQLLLAAGHEIGDFSESCILAVQEWRIFVHDEELA